ERARKDVLENILHRTVRASDDRIHDPGLDEIRMLAVDARLTWRGLLMDLAASIVPGHRVELRHASHFLLQVETCRVRVSDPLCDVVDGLLDCLIRPHRHRAETLNIAPAVQLAKNVQLVRSGVLFAEVFQLLDCHGLLTIRSSPGWHTSDMACTMSEP